MAEDLYQQIVRGIEIELDQYTNKLFKKIKPPILAKIQEIVGYALRGSSEYAALRSNTSEYHQFGIPEIERLMDAVIDRIISDIALNVAFRKRTGDYAAKFTIKLLDLNYTSILQMPEAVFITEKSYVLPWLEWLLLDGTQPVIVNFYFSGLAAAASRTGYGIMKNTSSWGVPSNIAGTQGNNWLTRSIEGISSILEAEVENALRDNL